MTSSLVQPYIDQENPNAVGTNNKGGRLGSLAGRQQVKTFGGSSNQAPLATPRRALGNVSNDPSKRALQGIDSTGKKSVNGANGGGNLVFKKSLHSQLGPVFKKPTISTPAPQGLTSNKKPLKLKSEGTTKTKMAEVLPSVCKDVFSDTEKMHIFDEEKEPNFTLIPDRDCLSRFLDRLGPVRAPLIHYPKNEDVEPDFSHMQLDPNSGRLQDFGTDSTLSSSSGASTVCDLPPIFEPSSLDSCLLSLPPLESVDFMDLNNFKDLYD